MSAATGPESTDVAGLTRDLYCLLSRFDERSQLSQLKPKGGLARNKEHNPVVAQLRRVKSFMNVAIRTFASIKLAVCLIVLLAAVIAIATLLETKYGRPYSQWYVYHSAWFLGLLGLLAASVFCAAFVRFPWKRHQTGFVLTHAGLLILLTGSVLTLYRGVEGQIAVVEEASTDQLTLSQLSQITASWADRPADRAYVFTFDSGPVDWRKGTELDLGCVDGMGVRVLKYYRHSQPVENWIADGHGRGGPLIQFKVKQAHAHGSASFGSPMPDKPIAGSLADQDYGAEVFVGPIAIRLQRATSDAMLADFLDPIDSELGEKGVLTVYFQDDVQRVKVDERVGQAVNIGGSGASVELVQYLANAKLDAGGQFKAIGNDARNPLVELKVSFPGEKQPFRQVAFAKSPLLNFDGVYGRDCPVKFTYQHPKIKPPTAVEFLQRRDGKLFGRTISNGKYQSIGEVTQGTRVDVQGGFTLTIDEYMPHARRDISFNRVEQTSEGNTSPETSAVEVQLTVAGTTQSLWLQRNSAEYEARVLDTTEGPLRVRYAAAKVPLGFSLKLVDLRRDTNPGQVGNAACSSLVRILDKQSLVDEERLISMNRPLLHNGFRVYQSSFREAGHGKDASIFNVAYDPGRPLKYLGSLLICGGIATMFYMKAYTLPDAARLHSAR
jgi:hypothetical protein